MRKMQNAKCKMQNHISNFKIKNFGFWFVILIFDICILNLLLSNSYAEEITILYTGDTHAMIYPCNCPKEPNGGLARRLTLIKQIRKNNPHTLLLDSGGFFAGGLLDEYTQNTELDSQRTKINLKAMALMKYDAVAIGDDGFNFGWDFLKETTSKPVLSFLSCNVLPKEGDGGSRNLSGMFEKAKWFEPYIIREISGTKIGIIGVTPLSAKQKAGGLEFSEPKHAVAQAVSDLKKNGVDIIVLLSSLAESEDLSLLNDIHGIDILIGGKVQARKAPFTKVANTLFVSPFWQGRSLGKLSLVVEDKKIKSYKVEELPLSKLIPDDPDINAILPSCFADSNCNKEGFLGSCQNPGSVNSSCAFNKANKISLSVITARDCITCNTEGPINFLKKQFSGLEVAYLYYPDPKADRLVKGLSIAGLPVYLLGKEIEREKGFDSLKSNIEKKGDFYMLKPQFSGLGYLLNRAKIKGRLDLFLSLYAQNSKELLEVMREFNPTIHFLAVELDGKFDAQNGNPEVEENLRAVCVQKYYPQKFWDYISCRTGSKNSSWWEDCLPNLEVNKIKSCAKGTEGASLLRENIGLNKELQIMFGPTYLVDNQEIFSSQGASSKEELKKIIKK